MKISWIAIVLALGLGVYAARADETPSPANHPPTETATLSGNTLMETGTQTAVSPAGTITPAERTKAEQDKKIRALIQQLNDPARATRKEAYQELLQIGQPALPQLQDAQKNATSRLAVELKLLIRRIAGPPPRKAAPARAAKQAPTPPSDVVFDALGNFGARIGEAADGLRVTDVQNGSVAQKMGLVAGDIINKINGRGVTTLDDIKQMLNNRPTDKPFVMEVTRQDQTVTLTLPPS